MYNLLDNAPCGFVTFTETGTIYAINTTLSNLLGYPSEDLIGRPVESLFSVGGRVFYQTHFFPLLKLHGKAEEIYFVLHPENGQDVPVLAYAVRQERNGETLYDCVLVPIHQRHRFEEELLQARKTAEEAIRLKEQALALLVEQNYMLAHLQEREHQIAEKLQEALQPLIPRTLPGLEIDAFYQPALDEARIGGDFSDVYTLDEDCYVLVVADLSGKGLQAATQIATVRHMLRALLYQRGTTIAQSLTSLNQMIVANGLLEGFATLFVGLYDRKQYSLTYVNAGQEPGLIRRGATGVIEELNSTGPVLGGYSGAVYTERVVSLAPGDILALFTDGLTEAGPNLIDLLDLEGVIEIFRASTDNAASSPSEITARIMAEVENAVTPAGIRDDVCLLVACVS